MRRRCGWQRVEGQRGAGQDGCRRPLRLPSPSPALTGSHGGLDAPTPPALIEPASWIRPWRSREAAVRKAGASGAAGSRDLSKALRAGHGIRKGNRARASVCRGDCLSELSLPVSDNQGTRVSTRGERCESGGTRRRQPTGGQAEQGYRAATRPSLPGSTTAFQAKRSGRSEWTRETRRTDSLHVPADLVELPG